MRFAHWRTCMSWYVGFHMRHDTIPGYVTLGIYLQLGPHEFAFLWGK